MSEARRGEFFLEFTGHRKDFLKLDTPAFSLNREGIGLAEAKDFRTSNAHAFLYAIDEPIRNGCEGIFTIRGVDGTAAGRQTSNAERRRSVLRDPAR
jgi:hypothetical protein